MTGRGYGWRAGSHSSRSGTCQAIASSVPLRVRQRTQSNFAPTHLPSHVRSLPMEVTPAGGRRFALGNPLAEAELVGRQHQGWPASVTGDARAAVDVAYREAVFSESLPQPKAFTITVHTLDESARAEKLAALGAYRTPLPGLLALNPRLAEPATLRDQATWRRDGPPS